MDVVFTDLDGTLLDHSTYSFAEAQPALALLKSKNVPLIFCTSKTRSEVEYWRGLLGNNHPFIVENGGAAFVPENYFNFPIPASVKRAVWRRDEGCCAYIGRDGRCRERGFLEYHHVQPSVLDPATHSPPTD